MPKIGRFVNLLPHPVFIGVDPGLSGGIAVIDNGEVTLHYMPQTEWDVCSLFRGLGLLDDQMGYRTRIGSIEHVNTGFPGSSKSTMAKLNGNYMGLRMAMSYAGISFEPVASQVWQKEYKIKRKKGEKQNKWKDRLRAVAQNLFPGLAIWERGVVQQRMICDALLIAEFAKRKHNSH